MSGLSRRRFLLSISSLPLVSLLRQCDIPLHEPLAGSTSSTWRFLSVHQADVVREATARLIPGPADDSRESGHPGAREANVVRYIDNFLGAFSSDPPLIYAGGPYSDRAGGTINYMTKFVPLGPVREQMWRQRLAAMQETYQEGIALLDSLAGGDFSQALPDEMDRILSYDGVADFRDVLFTHAIEGMYSVPEYGGNQDLVGWTDISCQGDREPTGFTDTQVSQSDGPDPIGPHPLTQQEFERILPLVSRRRSHGWKR